jgi:hypothetical protein
MRTIIDLSDPVLRDLKQLRKKEGGSSRPATKLRWSFQPKVRLSRGHQSAAGQEVIQSRPTRKWFVISSYAYLPRIHRWEELVRLAPRETFTSTR